MASEKGKDLHRVTDVTYETCKNKLDGLDQDECTAHVYPDHLENSSHRNTFANIFCADSLSSLWLLESYLLGLDIDVLVDSGVTNNFLLEACYDRLAAK